MELFIINNNGIMKPNKNGIIQIKCIKIELKMDVFDRF